MSSLIHNHTLTIKIESSSLLLNPSIESNIYYLSNLKELQIPELDLVLYLIKITYPKPLLYYYIDLFLSIVL